MWLYEPISLEANAFGQGPSNRILSLFIVEILGNRVCSEKGNSEIVGILYLSNSDRILMMTIKILSLRYTAFVSFSIVFLPFQSNLNGSFFMLNFWLIFKTNSLSLMIISQNFSEGSPISSALPLLEHLRIYVFVYLRSMLTFENFDLISLMILLVCFELTFR